MGDFLFGIFKRPYRATYQMLAFWLDDVTALGQYDDIVGLQPTGNRFLLAFLVWKRNIYVNVFQYVALLNFSALGDFVPFKPRHLNALKIDIEVK